MEKRTRTPSHLDVLDRFLDEAKAGVPDEWIVEQTGLPLKQVREWRNYRGISLDDKMVKRELITALQGLAPAFVTPQRTAEIPYGWKEPSFVIRAPLHYTLFARSVAFILDDLGLSADDAARALGTTPQDIRTADAVWKRYLKKKGEPCIGCGRLVVKRFGLFCSKRCEDQQK